MMKKAFIFFLVLTLTTPLFSAKAHARGVAAGGDVIFTDTMYGAAIGGLIGAAAYAVDTDDFGKKIGAGVIIGAVLGLTYGVYETKSFVEYKNGKAYVSVPTPEVENRGKETIYKLSLFKAEFK
ncbi:MAG: hypothetical protein OHK0040_01380 [bacterium]